MVGTAFSLAIVGYVINLAMGRTLAAKHGYDVDPNQVLLGLGQPGAAAFALRREGKSSDVLGSEQTCCSRGGSVALCHVGGEKDTAELCPVGWRKAGRGKGALGWALSALLPLQAQCFGSLLKHGEVRALLREQRKTWIPGVSPRYSGRQDIK